MLLGCSRTVAGFSRKGYMEQLKQIVLERELKERLRWLVRLRWYAAGCVFGVITFTHFVFGLPIPLLPLYIGNLVLFGYNGLVHWFGGRVEAPENSGVWFPKARRLANFQITFDLLLLTFFLHYSGGVENPFVFYFVFHMVIASILLSRKAAYFQFSVAVVCLGAMIFGEYYGILPHTHLRGFIPASSCFLEMPYLPGMFFVFISTLLLTVYMTTSIVDRLREGESELAVANRKLQEQDRIKSQYVLTVSHDLQVSLSAIQSCLKVVLSNFTGTLSDKAREMVCRAEERSQYLLLFVKDLLDLSKIRAAKEFQKQEVRLSETVSRVLQQLKRPAGEKDIRLDVLKCNGVSVSGNPQLLEHVLLNLIQNAIRYTPQKGRVSVECRCSNGNGTVEVVVTDTGIGIPLEDIPRIFDDFYRAGNAQILEKKGSGLGLSIVRQIVAAHRGEVWVESDIGKGSRFHFTLPGYTE